MIKYLIILALFIGCDNKIHYDCEEEKETIGDCKTNPDGICITVTETKCKELDPSDIPNIMGI